MSRLSPGPTSMVSTYATNRMRPLKHMRNLLVLVGVFGHDASLFEFDPAEHLVHADDYLSAKSVRDLLGGHFVPTVFFGWYFFPLFPKPRFA